MVEKKKVFITRVITPSGVAMMEQAGLEVDQWAEKRDITQEELTEVCARYDILVNAGTNKLDADFLRASKHLSLIALHAVGYDNVDVTEATRLGIPIGNTPGVVSRSTASTAFMLMQMAARRTMYNYRRIVEGRWKFFEPTAHLGIDLYGSTLGVFGLGKIGMEMARLCRDAFDMTIIYHNRNRNEEAEVLLGARYVSFEELLGSSDVLSLHASSNADNAGIFDHHAFRKMKKTAIFVNTARGALHHEGELCAALESGEIFAAGLDVTNPEPMDKDNPLLLMDNAIILPHIGTSTIQTREKMVRLIAENVIAAASGKPIPYAVNPEVYDRAQAPDKS